ncbi:MAG: RNA-binding transcriptional accessory protein, partial [Erysipelotrichaceae bacterium]|nr:RNA-binding transcriptional accessory protein [Erysipelotrichaceae bacterium]
MEERIIKTIADELKIAVKQVDTVLKMLSEGDTVPFIARYRKEATGALDEEKILYIEKQYKYQLNLAERKESVLNLIETQGKLTEELRAQIEACTRLSQVE